MHSFQARIVDIKWERLRHTGLGRSVQDIEALLQTLNPKTLYELIEKVRIQCSFTVNADLKNLNDEEVQSHYLFLHHTQTYLLLKYAIKHADIGLIVTGASLIVIGLMGGSFGSRHRETVQNV